MMGNICQALHHGPADAAAVAGEDRRGRLAGLSNETTN
jgi:hypothetical protein